MNTMTEYISEGKTLRIRQKANRQLGCFILATMVGIFILDNNIRMLRQEVAELKAQKETGTCDD